MIDSEQFFVFYLSIILGPLVCLWLISARRDRKMRLSANKAWLYRCPECFRFYESESMNEKVPCPICGRQNERLKLK